MPGEQTFQALRISTKCADLLLKPRELILQFVWHRRSWGTALAFFVPYQDRVVEDLQLCLWKRVSRI